jgi:hypothetical protein
MEVVTYISKECNIYFKGVNFLASPLLLGAPFLVAGGLKIVYELLVYRGSKNLSLPRKKQALVRLMSVCQSKAALKQGKRDRNAWL